MRHHVVVGASAAGVAAAFGMRAYGFDGRITVVDAGTDLPYERPPLSKSFLDLALPRPIQPATAYAQSDIELRLGTRVTALDVSRRTVELAGGERLSAGAVLLTTGVSARRLDIPGRDLGNVLVLRDVDDARAVAARLDAGGPLVLLGGGFVGLEAAAVARSRGLTVTVVELTELPLGGPLGPVLARRVVGRHASEGVRFRTGRRAVALHGTGVVEEVELDDGSRIEAATVLVGAGVVPNDDLARRAGVYTNGGIVGDSHGRTSNPWVWAAGDVTTYVSPWTGRRQRIEHWDVAQRHGTAVGANLAGADLRHVEVPYFWSDQYGQRIQMFGRYGDRDQLVVRPMDDPERFLGFWVRDGSRVVAAAGVDAGKELRAAKSLIEGRVRVDPAALADPAVSLRSLVRTPVAAQLLAATVTADLTAR